MRKATVLTAALALSATPAGAEPVGAFGEHADVGEGSTPGSARFEDGTYRVTASGANIWGSADEFHYLWTRRSGDVHIAADIAFEGEGVDPHRKAGLMIRQNPSAGSPYADVMVHGDGMVSLQYREVQDGPTRQIVAPMRDPRRVRLEREGDFVYFSLAGANGELAHAGGGFRMAFQAPYLVGLALSAHNDDVTETATFSDVEIAVPRLGYVPDTGYAASVESTLEVIAISGNRDRRIVRHFDGKIEAPNWSRDGKSLIYNSEGRIWRIPIEGGEPVEIDTGRFVDNNNDHGLSPDGTKLAISDQIETDNLSRIHVVALDGSEPVQTVVDDPQARSYWHGWSPDGQTLAYVRVGLDDGSYDIWAKDLGSGTARPLVIGPGVDDGPEYSPDGRHLHFNSSRSGAMALWRASADGSDPVRLTHDPARRDWFPHVSPDGQWVVYVSFGDDIALEDHPPNREDVQLRIMPADGSAPPEILTRLFGGQGTINVPSWSPDGTQVAFVSYRLQR